MPQNENYNARTKFNNWPAHNEYVIDAPGHTLHIGKGIKDYKTAQLIAGLLEAAYQTGILVGQQQEALKADEARSEAVTTDNTPPE